MPIFLIILSFLVSAQVPEQKSLTGIFIFIIVLIVFVLVLGVFWIWMLIDCIKREFDNKALWIIIIVLIGVLGAIIYYFAIKRPNATKQAKQSVKK